MTIQISPPYVECTALQSWVAANTTMIRSFSVRSTSQSGSLISAPVEEQIIPIAAIHSQQDGQTFTIEARITPSENFSCCYVLACPKCRQEVRNLRKREFHCPGCNEKNMLIPRCRFEVTLADASGSTKGTVTDEQGAELLSLNAEEIYEKVHSDWPEHEQPKIPDTYFQIQVKKAFPRGARPNTPRVLIIAINKGERADCTPTLSTTASTQGKNKRPKQEIIPVKGETANPTGKGNILSQQAEMKPATPSKKQ